MSDWLFDLGNTRLKHAPLASAAGLGETIAVSHDGEAFADGWLAALPQCIDVAWVASVGPPALRARLLQALAPRALRVVQATVQREMGGVHIAYPEPARLGIDRALAMVAAHARAPGWSLVVGVGTALTVDLVDGDGRHRGGRIAPSPELMREALHARAPHLPRAGGDYAEFGVDTDAALASGCLGAALGLVERSLREAAALAGEVPRTWLHGGGAAALLPHLAAATHAPSLVIEGLARLARRPSVAG